MEQTVGLDAEVKLTRQVVGLGAVTKVDRSVVSPSTVVMEPVVVAFGKITKEVDDFVNNEAHNGEGFEDADATKDVVALPRLVVPVANRRAEMAVKVHSKEASRGSEMAVKMHSKEASRGSRSAGVFRPEWATMVDPVEPRQSEHIKRQQSGDEDSVQKATRRAQVRNLELDPCYLLEWALAEGLGTFAETSPE